MAGDNDNDDDLYQTAELQFGDNTRSIMMGCMIALLIEGVIVLILHTNWGRILEGTLLTSAAVTGICAVFCKWQRGFTIYTVIGWVMLVLVALKTWQLVNNDKSDISDWSICVVTALVSLPSTVLTTGILCRQHCCPNGSRGGSDGSGRHQLLPNGEEGPRRDTGDDFGNPAMSQSAYHSYENLPKPTASSSSTGDAGADFGAPSSGYTAPSSSARTDDGAEFGGPGRKTFQPPPTSERSEPAPTLAAGSSQQQPQPQLQPQPSAKPVDDGSDFGAGGGSSFGY